MVSYTNKSPVAEKVNAGEALDEAVGVVAESERASMRIHARCKSLPGEAWSTLVPQKVVARRAKILGSRCR